VASLISSALRCCWGKNCHWKGGFELIGYHLEFPVPQLKNMSTLKAQVEGIMMMWRKHLLILVQKFSLTYSMRISSFLPP